MKGTIGDLVTFSRKLSEAADWDPSIVAAAAKIIEEGYSGNVRDIPDLAAALAV